NFCQVKFSNQIPAGVNKRFPNTCSTKSPFSLRKVKNENGQFDSSLSAADRRQKFHQSRQHVVPPSNNVNSDVQMAQQKPSIFQDFISCHPTNRLTEFYTPVFCANSKIILPPIQNTNHVQENRINFPQVKKKYLIGEITHFPALCNLSSKHVKRTYISKVPRLPPILPPPAAPPPSKSTIVGTRFK
ncbi:uncharacterized protein CEXT_73441, partial [Caerostris extrusa]